MLSGLSSVSLEVAWNISHSCSSPDVKINVGVLLATTKPSLECQLGHTLLTYLIKVQMPSLGLSVFVVFMADTLYFLNVDKGVYLHPPCVISRA